MPYIDVIYSFWCMKYFIIKKDKNLLTHFKGKGGYLFLHIQLVKFVFL